MDKVGDSSWVEIPTAKQRLRAELTPEGWTYSVYDLRSRTYLLLPQRANSEEQEQVKAERWAIGAGLLSPSDVVRWERGPRE